MEKEELGWNRRSKDKTNINTTKLVSVCVWGVYVCVLYNNKKNKDCVMEIYLFL